MPSVRIEQLLISDNIGDDLSNKAMASAGPVRIDHLEVIEVVGQNLE